MEQLERDLFIPPLEHDIYRATGLRITLRIDDGVYCGGPVGEPGFHGDLPETIRVFLQHHGYIMSAIGGAIGKTALGAIKDIVVRHFQARAETRRRVGIEEKTTVEIYGPDDKTVVSVVEVEAGKPPKNKR